MAERPGSAPLFERDQELEAIDAGLADAERAEGSLLLIEGEAGIGKSRLVGEACARARARQIRVLSARGNELERDFAFGVVLQLLSEPPERVPGDELFAGAAAGFPLLYSLHWMFVRLCERGATLITVDDAQWADAASLEWLNFEASRLDELGAAIIVGLRRGESGGDLVRRLLVRDRAVVLTPRPLGQASVTRMVRTAYARASEEFCAACGHATGGNPLYLASLLAAVPGTNLDPARAGAEQIAGLRPRAVEASVADRLERLGDRARALAEALAVLGDGTPLSLVAELAEVDSELAPAVAERLVAAGLLRDADPPAFTHPLVQEAIAGSLAAPRRARAHRRAAELLLGIGERHERVAAQLLRAERGAGEWARAALVAAAREAASRGAPEAARRYLGRALEESPSVRARGELLARLALVEAGRDAAGAWETLKRGLDSIGDAPLRAGYLRDFALRAFGGRTFLVSADALRREAGCVSQERPELARELEALALVSEAYSLSSDRADDLERMRAIVAQPDLTRNAAGRALLGQMASTAAMQGRSPDEVAPIARRALEAMDGLDDPGDLLTAALAANTLTLVDECSEADAVLTRAMEAAQRAGLGLPYAVTSHCRAINRYRQGRVTEAAADADSAVRGYEHGWHWGLPGSHAYLSQAHLERGELAEAEAALELPEGEEAWAESTLFVLYLEARGRLRLAAGDPAGALADFRGAGERAERAGLDNPAILPWRARAAEAARALGSKEAVELAEEDLARARAWGTPWGLGVCLRARGLVAEGAEAVRWLGEAAEILDGAPNRLEHARVLIDHGAALRRTGRRREARDVLHRGRSGAHACEAHALVRIAEEELAAAGARLVRRELSGAEALTPSERRVAELAAAGLSNSEIAASLFVALRTVETHLTHSYRKLEVSSRRELPRALNR